jgi:hypothetical protein
MSEARKSPIKGRPLREAGQSVGEEAKRLYERDLEEPAMMAAALLGWGAIEVLGWYVNWPRQPALGVLAVAGAIGYLAWKVFRTRPRLRDLRLALDGERAVGQFLDSLRSTGYKVVHDVPGDGFNVDHVIVGPTGVFTIETKTWSVPEKGIPKIVFDGQRVRTASFTPDRDPVAQAKAQASWLKGLLQESTAVRFPVHPVVLFPGWYVKQGRGMAKEIWVLNPRALPSFLAQAPILLSAEQISMAGFHLSRYVRSYRSANS